jgi:hypothetical protein
LARSTHAYVVMNFPSDTAGEKDEQFEFIAADVFLRRFIIDLHSANPVFIALGADVFFWIAGEIGCSCSLDRAVFRLFGDTDINIAAGGAIRMNCVEKADSLLCSRSNDTGKLLFCQPFLSRRMQTTKVVPMPVP